MLAITPILFISLATAASGAFAAPPAELPQPESGLWEMKTSVAEMGGMTMNFESCVEGTLEDLLTHPEVQNAECTDQRIDRDGNRVAVSATCIVEGSTARIDGVFTGDFVRNYQGQVRTTYTPPLHGMATTNMKIDARWMSACRTGQKPGDVVMTGMPKLPGINLDELMKNIPGMQR